MGVPVPKGYRIRDIDELESTFDRWVIRSVIKPLDGNHGKGATVGIKTSRTPESRSKRQRNIAVG